jgi:hypothetical protein
MPFPDGISGGPRISGIMPDQRRCWFGKATWLTVCVGEWLSSDVFPADGTV